MIVLILFLGVVMVWCLFNLAEATYRLHRLAKFQAALESFRTGESKCTCTNPDWDKFSEEISPGSPLRFCRACESFRYDKDREKTFVGRHFTQ